MSSLIDRGFKPPLAEIEERKKYINTLADLASTGVRGRDHFSGLTIPELRDLGVAILSQENVFDGYTLMARTPRDGQRTYYDRIIGPQHERSRDIVNLALKGYEPRQVEKALDIAAGTGESTLLLANTVRSITAVDVHKDLLALAARKLRRLKNNRRISDYQTEVMDATKLEFPDDSFDIVTDNALIAYLSPEEVVGYWKGIKRVLKPGGRYYSYIAEDYDRRIYQRTPKARLAGEVAGALFAFSYMRYQTANPPLFYAELAGFEGGSLEIRGETYKEEVLRWTKPL